MNRLFKLLKRFDHHRKALIPLFEANCSLASRSMPEFNHDPTLHWTSFTEFVESPLITLFPSRALASSCQTFGQLFRRLHKLLKSRRQLAFRRNAIVDTQTIANP